MDNTADNLNKFLNDDKVRRVIESAKDPGALTTKYTQDKNARQNLINKLYKKENNEEVKVNENNNEEVKVNENNNEEVKTEDDDLIEWLRNYKFNDWSKDKPEKYNLRKTRHEIENKHPREYGIMDVVRNFGIDEELGTYSAKRVGRDILSVITDLLLGAGVVKGLKGVKLHGKYKDKISLDNIINSNLTSKSKFNPKAVSRIEVGPDKPISKIPDKADVIIGKNGYILPDKIANFLKTREKPINTNKILGATSAVGLAVKKASELFNPSNNFTNADNYKYFLWNNKNLSDQYKKQLNDMVETKEDKDRLNSWFKEQDDKADQFNQLNDKSRNALVKESIRWTKAIRDANMEDAKKVDRDLSGFLKFKELNTNPFMRNELKDVDINDFKYDIDVISNLDNKSRLIYFPIDYLNFLTNLATSNGIIIDTPKNLNKD